jgi:intracellular multiplication protein IcmE
MVAVSVAAKEAHTNSKSYAQEQMAQAGMLTTCKDARKAGFSCKEAREAGFSCKEAMEAGFSCKEAREAGFSCKDASEAGFTPLEWLRG